MVIVAAQLVRRSLRTGDPGLAEHVPVGLQWIGHRLDWKRMGLDNPLHIAFLVVILLLVFGAKRLPEIGRSLGVRHAGVQGVPSPASPSPSSPR